MRHLVIITVLLIGLLKCDPGLLAQSKTADTIRIVLIVDKNPMPGANYVIKGTTSGTVSDKDGLATLIVPADKDKVVVSIIGPYIELNILRPVDSIYFDLDSRKATYYLERKKIRTRKQIVSGY